MLGRNVLVPQTLCFRIRQRHDFFQLLCIIICHKPNDYKFNKLLNSSSEITFIPNFSAFFNLLPAFSPASK